MKTQPASALTCPGALNANSFMPSFLTPSKSCSIFLASLFLYLLPIARSQAANITVSIDLNSGDVDVAGSYVLLDATTTVPSTEPLLTTAGGGWSFLTNGAAGTALSPTVGNVLGVTLNFLLGSITWNITDTSNGNLEIVSGNVDEISFGTDSAFIQFDGVATVNFPASVDAGDIFNINGNFTLAGLEAAKLAAFSPGSHVSTYNGQSLTLTFIPEPSSTFLFLLGAFGMVMRRRR